MSESRILSVLAALFVCIALPAAASGQSIAPGPVAEPSAPALTPSNHEVAILRAINGVRAANGRQPLGLGRRLHVAAKAHSVDMARRGYFDHGPFVRRLRRFGIRSRHIGENIAYATEPGFSAALVLQMWMASPPHRSILLDQSFRRVGIGVAGGSTRLVTADFAG